MMHRPGAPLSAGTARQGSVSYCSAPVLNRVIISFVRLKSSGWSSISSRDTHWAYFYSFSSMWMVPSPSSSQKKPISRSLAMPQGWEA